MMDFPLNDLLDEQACCNYLLSVLHPAGLLCPNRHPLEQCYVHKRDRAPVLDWRCKTCGRCFNLFTGTVWQNTRRSMAQIVQILRGVVQGVSTAQLSRELNVAYGHLLDLRHRLQALAERTRETNPLSDAVTEADEMYQNAGEKRRSASRPRRPAATAGQQTPRPRNL